MYSIQDQAKIINDLVYYGGFDYPSVLRMPVFERDFHHARVLENKKQEQDFWISLHGRKKKT